MNNIPLVRVRYADSFAKVLNRMDAPTERILNTVGLSEEILSVPDGFMPVEQLWRFTALASNYTGVTDIGLDSGLTPLGQHSQFGHKVMASTNLHQAIILFCKLARTELTNSNFHLRQQQDMAWFCGGEVEGTDDEIQQVELYRLGMIIQVIRAAIGIDWQPRELQLQSQNEKAVHDTELIRNANVRFGCKMSAVGLPHHTLSLTLQRTKDKIPAAKADSGLTLSPEPEISLEYAIKEIIRTHIRSQQGGIQRVSKSLDLSVRTLQRRLSENGLNFSQLIEQTRIETALMMLENTNAKIVEIAMETGYKEATHFTRAFKRNTGITPHQYRLHHQSANLKLTSSEVLIKSVLPAMH